MDLSKEVVSQIGTAEVATTANRSGKSASWYERTAGGWRFGVLIGTVLAFLTLIINVAVTAVTAAKKETVIYGGSGKTLYEGDCNKVRELNIGIHFLINLLSTALLSASNYGMQCLSAPTRAEVDKAHSRRVWLNIGVIGARNISRISGKRVFLWWILVLSSMPLHLFYNATFYASIYAREYVIFSATEQMVRPESPGTWLGLKNETDSGYPTFGYAVAQRLRIKALNNQLTRLESQDCINAYATAFQTQRGSVILVSDDNVVMPEPTAERALQSVLVPGRGGQCAPHPFEWICGGDMWDCDFTTTCAANWQSIDADNWRPLGPKVSYCLSENTDQLCRLQFNKHLALVVIAFNVAKVLVLAYLLFGVLQNPLLTMGDAVASFLKRPDETTRGLCLMSKEYIMQWTHRNFTSVPVGLPYNATRKRWSTAVSKRRWATCMILYTLIIMLCLGLFLYGIIGRTVSADQLLSLPLGAVDPRAFIYSWGTDGGGTNTLLFNVLMANLPQLALSAIYFSYNGLFTCFCLGSEWASYSTQRKGLRVSQNPEGSQRSTYFLQLPYRFAIPLIVLSGVLHWLCSQSIFLVSVFLDTSSIFEGSLIIDAAPDLNIPLESALCGYSPRAIITVVVIGVIMVCIAFAMGRLRFQTGMPVAGSCSAAISALCHAPGSESGVEAATMPVQWGVTGADAYANATFMHCSFSSRQVQEPQSGVLYAGSDVFQGTSAQLASKARFGPTSLVKRASAVHPSMVSDREEI